MQLEIGERVFHKHFGEGKVIAKDSDGSYLIYFFKENQDLHDGSCGLWNHCWWVFPREVARCNSLHWIIGRRQRWITTIE